MQKLTHCVVTGAMSQRAVAVAKNPGMSRSGRRSAWRRRQQEPGACTSLSAPPHRKHMCVFLEAVLLGLPCLGRTCPDISGHATAASHGQAVPRRELGDHVTWNRLCRQPRAALCARRTAPSSHDSRTFLDHVNARSGQPAQARENTGAPSDYLLPDDAILVQCNTAPNLWIVRVMINPAASRDQSPSIPEWPRKPT